MKLLMKAIGYIRSIFGDGAAASFSRWATACTVATSCWSVIHLVRLNHVLPNGADLAGMAVWMVAPYSVNKAAEAWSPARPPAPPDPPPVPGA